MQTLERPLTEEPPTQLVRRRTVAARLACSETTLWRLVRDGKFPRPIQISAGAVGWRSADVERWIAARAKDSQEPHDDGTEALANEAAPTRTTRRKRRARKRMPSPKSPTPAGAAT